MSDRVRLGRAVLTRVVETSFEPGIDMFGATPEESWAGNADLLVPDFLNLATRSWRVAVQTRAHRWCGWMRARRRCSSAI